MHQCVHCGKVYPDGSKALLEGCSCGSHFFFYIKDGAYEKLLLELADQHACKAVEDEIKRLIPILKRDVVSKQNPATVSATNRR